MNNESTTAPVHGNCSCGTERKCKKEKIEYTSVSNVSDKKQNKVIYKPRPIINKNPKIGRNELCPCGSGKKFKKCCIRK